MRKALTHLGRGLLQIVPYRLRTAIITRINRFRARRSSFRGSQAFWEERYATGGTSGPGSYGRLAEFKAEIINAFLEANNIRSAIEFGCGDGNQIGLIKYKKYYGFDVSSAAVALCQEKFSGDGSKSFSLMREYAGQKAELTLSLDVLFHLVEDDVFEEYVKQLFSASEQWVIIYSSNVDLVDLNIFRPLNQVRHRRFTDFVDRDIPEFEMVETIRNPYASRLKQQDDESLSHFFIYRRISGSGE